RIDGGLSVLGGDDDLGRGQHALATQFIDHGPDRVVNEPDRAFQLWREDGAGRGAARLVPARNVVRGTLRSGAANTRQDRVDQLLPHADGLEVHAEDGRHGSSQGRGRVAAVDLVEDSVDFDLVVGFGVTDQVGNEVRTRSAGVGQGEGNGSPAGV